MVESIKQNNRITLPGVSTVADGIAVKQPNELTFEFCKKYYASP